MPTDQAIRRKRYLATGHFREQPGYLVDRPQGCHDWLLIYTVAGRGCFGHAQGEFETGSHEAVLIAPEVRHRYGVAATAARWELLWAHFLPPTDWRAFLQWPAPEPGWGQVPITGRRRQQEIMKYFRDLVRLTAGYRPHRESLALNALEAVIICCHEQVTLTHGDSVDPRLRDVLDYVCRNLKDPLTVNELAQRCHLSPSRFAHLFREQMQMTPQQFVEAQRLDRARELLEHTGYTISSIAQQVGFDSPFYFTRRFKLATGLSPRAYRQQASQ